MSERPLQPLPCGARRVSVRASRNVSATAQLQRRLALAEWDRGHFDNAQTHLEKGLQVLDGSEPSAELADLFHVRVILLGRRGDDRVEHCGKGLATLAEQLGSRRVLAEAYLAQIRSFSDDRDVVITRELAQHALNEAEAANEPLLVQRAHDILALLPTLWANIGWHVIMQCSALRWPGSLAHQHSKCIPETAWSQST